MSMSDPTASEVPQAADRSVTVRRRWAEHLGTALTVGYLLLIAIGMFHSLIRYFRFGINIFEFAQPSDFLLATFRDPLVILATVAPILLSWAYLSLSYRLGKRTWDRRRAAGRPIAWWKFARFVPGSFERARAWIWGLTMFMWVLAVGFWYAKRSADAT